MRYRLLFLNLFPEIGGAETSLIYLLQHLDPQVFELHVIVPRPGLFSQRLSQTSAQVHYLNVPGYTIRTLFLPGSNPLALWQFYQLCKHLQPDLIHLTHITQAFYAGVIKRFLHIPVIAISWMNSDSIYWYQDLITHFGTDQILAVNPKLKKRLTAKNIIPPNKIKVVTPGIDTKYFKPIQNKSNYKQNLGIPKHDLVITIASRFDPTKDHLTFFQAMNLVSSKVSKFTILVAQDTNINLESTNHSASQIKQQIDEYLRQHSILAKQVIFTEYQSDMRPIYHATDILISTSIYESLGMIHMEAAACGLPIVSTNYDGQHLIVKHHQTGFLVPLKRPDLIAKYILLLARNAHLRNQYSKAARLHILNNFSIQKYSKRIASQYFSLLHKS